MNGWSVAKALLCIVAGALLTLGIQDLLVYQAGSGGATQDVECRDYVLNLGAHEGPTAVACPHDQHVMVQATDYGRNTFCRCPKPVEEK